jgi:hypothetical protein
MLAVSANGVVEFDGADGWVELRRTGGARSGVGTAEVGGETVVVEEVRAVREEVSRSGGGRRKSENARIGPVEDTVPRLFRPVWALIALSAHSTERLRPIALRLPHPNRCEEVKGLRVELSVPHFQHLRWKRRRGLRALEGGFFPGFRRNRTEVGER